jgi:hypothetical protein
MISLLSVLAWAGPPHLYQSLAICDYSLPPGPRPPTGQGFCSTGPYQQTNSISYSIVRPANQVIFTVGTEGAIAEGALHWSNAAGSSIQGAADWSITAGAYDVGFDYECNQTNDIIPVTGASMQFVCPVGANQLSPACTHNYVSSAGSYCSIAESDVYINVDVLWDDVALPTTLSHSSPARNSMKQLMLHEFGHVLGLTDDSAWGTPGIVRLMDGEVPNGGDPGGDGGPPVSPSPRVGIQEFQMLSQFKPLTGASYNNLMLYKWERDTDSRAHEVWTVPHATTQGQHWAACRCECLQWQPVDWPRGPHFLHAGANFVGTGPSAEVKWYLYQAGTHASCEAGFRMDLAATGKIEGYEIVPPSGGTMLAGETYHVGKSATLCVPNTAPAGQYKICAKITPIGGGAEASTSDNTVYSDKYFEVVLPPNCAVSGANYVCP